MNNAEKDYTIKVPVYVSEVMEKPNDMFGGITYTNMIDSIVRKIDSYNANPFEIRNTKRNKTFEKRLTKVEYTKVDLGNCPALLLKMTSFNTNYFDGFFERENRIEFTKETKVGSDNNFMLVCPHIDGLNPEGYKYQWIFLIYEDPHKENADIVSTAKLVLKKILQIEVKNIKLNTVIDTLRNEKVAPKLIVKLTTLDFDSEDESAKFRTYIVGSSVKTIVEREYENLPADNAVALIEKENIVSRNFKLVKRLIFGNKEYRITQKFDQEVNQRISEMVEEIYNCEVSISENDLQNQVYDVNFVVDKLKAVLLDYLKNGNE